MSTQPTDSSILIQTITNIGKRAVESELDFEIKAAIKRVEARKDEIITAAILDVVKTIDIQNMNDRLVVTIKKQQ